MTKPEITRFINDALLMIKTPDVSPQKKEFYKAGVRDLVRQMQKQIDRME